MDPPVKNRDGCAKAILNLMDLPKFPIKDLKMGEGVKVLDRIREQAKDLSHRLEKLRGYL